MREAWSRGESGAADSAVLPRRQDDEQADDGRLVDNSALVSLAGEPLARRFRHWRGASGRRYIFSVHERRACPAYEDAVLLVALVEPDGGRRIVFIADTGGLPEIALGRALEKVADRDGAIEFHIHLLAASRAERSALMGDLTGGTISLATEPPARRASGP